MDLVYDFTPRPQSAEPQPTNSHSTGDHPVGAVIWGDAGVRTRRLAEDCAAAGLTVVATHDLRSLNADTARAAALRTRPDTVLVVESTEIGAARLAALAELDSQLARTLAPLVVSTSMEALDAVFGCFASTPAKFHVGPGRADRVLLLSYARLRTGRGRVREMSAHEQQMLRELSAQVGALVGQLSRGEGGFAPAQPGAIGPQGSPASGLEGQRRTRPALPDPARVRAILRQRQRRAAIFADNLFADPAWDMMLDLTAARVERRRVSVTSLCIASGVPATTALRWIAQLEEAGLFERVRDESDGRRAFITLTDRCAEAMARYFSEAEGPLDAAL